MTALFMLLSVNSDALVAGFAYGMRKVRIPLLSALVISAFSTLYSALAMLAGSFLKSLLPQWFSHIFGAAVLVLIGLWMILDTLRGEKRPAPAVKHDGCTLFNLVIKSWGITVSVVRDPSLCDFDASSRIDLRESVYLSLALSADALGVGLACAMSGTVHISLPLFIGLVQLGLMYIGLFSGRFLSGCIKIKKRTCGMISGTLLILTGLIHIAM